MGMTIVWFNEDYLFCQPGWVWMCMHECKLEYFLSFLRNREFSVDMSAMLILRIDYEVKHAGTCC